MRLDRPFPMVGVELYGALCACIAHLVYLQPGSPVHECASPPPSRARAPRAKLECALSECPTVLTPPLSVAFTPSVVNFPGFSRDFDCFDSENQWDGKVVFVGF